jgi:hypothetical protein
MSANSSPQTCNRTLLPRRLQGRKTLADLLDTGLENFAQPFGMGAALPCHDAKAAIGHGQGAGKEIGRRQPRNSFRRLATGFFAGEFGAGFSPTPSTGALARRFVAAAGVIDHVAEARRRKTSSGHLEGLPPRLGATKRFTTVGDDSLFHGGKQRASACRAH